LHSLRISFLPLSHDELGSSPRESGSLIEKNAGRRIGKKFANLRLLFGYMWAASGQEASLHGQAKLAMRNEFWKTAGVDWGASRFAGRTAAFSKLMADLNRLHVTRTCFARARTSIGRARVDRSPNDAANSVDRISAAREGNQDQMPSSWFATSRR